MRNTLVRSELSWCCVISPCRQKTLQMFCLPKDAFAYRSVVGVCLYLPRHRPDLLLPVKELSGYMSKPTHQASQKLKKLIGYLKSTADYCVVLETPTPGQGKWKSTDKFWALQSFTDAGWSSNQRLRSSFGLRCICIWFLENPQGCFP